MQGAGFIAIWSDLTPEDEGFLDEIDTKAAEHLPSGVCAQCAGWGEKHWSFDCESTSAELDGIAEARLQL